jgi:hypothetical protein
VYVPVYRPVYTEVVQERVYVPAPTQVIYVNRAEPVVVQQAPTPQPQQSIEINRNDGTRIQLPEGRSYPGGDIPTDAIPGARPQGQTQPSSGINLDQATLDRNAALAAKSDSLVRNGVTTASVRTVASARLPEPPSR